MLRQKLTYGSVFCAVEHANNSAYYHLSLKKKKGELEIVHNELFKELNLLLDTIKGQKHAYLIINNEQVLTKQVSFVHTSDERVVKAAFPNLNLNDFYYEVLQNESSSIVCICRKELVEGLVKQYLEKGVSIIHFSLGNIGFQSLLPYLNDAAFSTSNATVEVENQKIVQCTKETGANEHYMINGLEIDSHQLLPLAGIVSYYSGVKNSSEEQYQESLVKEFQQKRFFELGIRIGLGFLFAILLINFMVFSSYRAQVGDLTAELALNESYKKQLLSLDEVVSKKKKLVESIQSTSNSKVIWYFEQIAKSVPRSILLNEVNYQPLARSVRESKPLLFKNNRIVVKGISKNNQDFTAWIRQLEEYDWIQKVSFDQYGSGKTSVTSFDFSIQVNSDNHDK